MGTGGVGVGVVVSVVSVVTVSSFKILLAVTLRTHVGHNKYPDFKTLSWVTIDLCVTGVSAMRDRYPHSSSSSAMRYKIPVLLMSI